MKTRRLSAEQLRTLAARMVAAKTEREKEALKEQLIDGFYGKRVPKIQRVRLDDVDSVARRRRLAEVLSSVPFPHYEQGPEHGLLVRIEEDGSRTIGRFIGRKWIPESEEWLFRNSSALASVRKGMKEAGQGKVVPRRPKGSIKEQKRPKKIPPFRVPVTPRKKLEPPSGYKSWLDYVVETMETRSLYHDHLWGNQPQWPSSVSRDDFVSAAKAELSALRTRKRVLLPEFEKMMKGPPGDDIRKALDEERGGE